jgi:cytochrome c553
MKLAMTSLLLVLTLSACGQAARDAKLKQLPGYQAATAACSPCHAMPFPPDRPAIAWPAIVARMENYMRSSGRPVPDQATHDTIVQYFETGSQF